MSSMRKFRETLWFKKGELDPDEAVRAGSRDDDEDPRGAAYALDPRPPADCYRDDGSVTSRDSAVFGVRTGVTQEMEPITEAPPVWVAGGRQLVHAASPEKSEMHPRVLRRIARSDGWIARPTCPPDLIAVDKEEIRQGREEAGLTDQPFTWAHENFVYIVENGSPDEVVRRQQEAYRRLTGTARPWDYIEAVYLNGTVDRIQESVPLR